MRNRLTNRRKEARHYDNNDVLSLNNAYDDPDPDKYDLSTPDHFQELPDMNRDWLDDLDAYDSEHHFLKPLKDDGGNQKMARAKQARAALMKKAALKKAEACLKIAEHVFPDAINEFVDSQAADFMNLPDRVVLSTLKRIAAYESEPDKVDALLGKRAEAEASEMEAPEMEAPDAADAEMPDMEGEEAPDMEGEEAPDTEGAEASEGDNEALLNELEGALATTKASINPSTEFGDMFAYDGSVDDISDVVTASFDRELTELFTEEYSSANHLRKSASVNKSKPKNFRLSQAFGNAVPKGAGQDLAASLWDTSPNVADSFK